MAYDLKRSYFNDLRERAVAPGAAISEEGQVLVYVDAGDGTLAVQPSAAAAGEVVAGFAITDALKYATATVVEELTVPAGGGTVALSHGNLIVGAPGPELVFDVTAAAALVFAAGAPAAGQYGANYTTGTLTFNAAEAGNTVRITYRYTPTLEETLATEHERHISNRAQDFFSSVAVGCMEGEIFSTEYDTSQAYVVGAAVYSGAAGRLTSAAGGTQLGVVSQVPGVSDGMLGVKFHLAS